MASCFAIVPMDDGGRFDKRFDDTFDPAIKAAELEPYRIDRDPGAVVLIDDIENGIRNADICFAEISTDNPNVWYELGFALAAGKEVVMVCAEDRSGFPFDIRHRKIITYKTEAPRDFEKLGSDLTAALKAALNRRATMETAASNSNAAPVAGLSPQELAALVSIAESDDEVSSYQLRQEMSSVGFTDIATRLATRHLERLGLVTERRMEDRDGNAYVTYAVSDSGLDWLETNQERLALRYDRPGHDPRDDRASLPY